MCRCGFEIFSQEGTQSCHILFAFLFCLLRFRGFCCFRPCPKNGEKFTEGGVIADEVLVARDGDVAVSACIDRNIHFASFLRTHRQRIFCGHHHLSRRQPKKAGHDDSRVSSRPFHAGSLYWLYKVPSWTDRLNIRCRMHPALRYYFYGSPGSWHWSPTSRELCLAYC